VSIGSPDAWRERAENFLESFLGEQGEPDVCHYYKRAEELLKWAGELKAQPEQPAESPPETEAEALRKTLLGAMVKVGVLDQSALVVPWGAPALLRLAGLWLSDGLPWVREGPRHEALMNALGRLEQRTGTLETCWANLNQDVLELKAWRHEHQEKK
jgi:hypothetical protein